MTSFDNYLRHKSPDHSLNAVLNDLSLIFERISRELRSGTEGYEATKNVYGDRQVKMDMVTNRFFVDVLSKNGHVGLIGSEEIPEPVRTENEGGFSVFFDPLDGSSVVDANCAVGSIVGIFEAGDVLGRTGREQVASLMCVYGPRLTFLITVSGDQSGSVDEFIYDSHSGGFVLFHENVKLEEGKIFAPGNLNAAQPGTWYADLLRYWIENGYKLRYSGGMVPDVNQLFRKGGGVYLYPGTAEHPEGKLRLLFECAPIALLIERAGGLAFSNDVPVLDVPVVSYDQQIPLFLGSAEEVMRIREFIPMT